MEIHDRKMRALPANRAKGKPFIEILNRKSSQPKRCTRAPGLFFQMSI